MSLHENNIELVAVADEDCVGQKCADREVVSIEALDGLDFDRIILTKFSKRGDVILRKLLETKGEVVDICETKTHKGDQ